MSVQHAITLDWTLALGMAVVVYLLGYGMKKYIGILSKYAIPTAVIGGVKLSHY